MATDTGPIYVAFSVGKVRFLYGNQGDGDLGSVDPAEPRLRSVITVEYGACRLDGVCG